MWLTKFIQKFFLIKNQEQKQNPKIIENLKILDTVWIKDDGILYEGWIFDITRRCIIVVYAPDLRDFRFRIDKQFDKTEVEQDNKILYCNEPTNETYIRISRE